MQEKKKSDSIHAQLNCCKQSRPVLSVLKLSLAVNLSAERKKEGRNSFLIVT